MNQDLHHDFPILVDPFSRKPLIYSGEFYCSELNNDQRQRHYPVVNGIPRILPDNSNYVEAFGEQWLRWRTTQLDSHSGTTITKTRLLRCMGDYLLSDLSQSSPELHVLEVGCGAGRFTEILLQFPAAKVTSIDLSIAVEANQDNFPQDERHRIVQCDIMHSPFEFGSFDIVMCLGVLQHTPSPEATIAKLYELVRLGGTLIVDHYTPEIKRLTKLGMLCLRPIIKRLPTRTRMRACEILVSVFFPIHKAIRNIPYAQQIFSRLSPITTYFHAYPQLNEQLQYEWALLDTHDGLTDWFKHLRTPSQIEAALASLGAKNIEVWKGGNGVEARCIKT